MSFLCKLSRNKLESTATYNDDKINRSGRNGSYRKYIRLNQHISLPYIKEFAKSHNNANANANANNTKSSGNGNVNNYQCQINNSKSSAYITNDNLSKNNSLAIATIKRTQSSDYSLSKCQSNKPKFSIKSKTRKMFDKIFQIDSNFITKVNKLKCDNRIAHHKHFDLPSYQNELLKIAAINTSTENLRQLSEDFRSLNELVNCKYAMKKTKWQILAKRISSIAPENLLLKLNSLQTKGKRPKAYLSEIIPLMSNQISLTKSNSIIS